MSGLTMGSLFDGIGGFPLAAIRSGITPVWASEIEAYTILLCLDNDEAGHQASRRMREQLDARYSVERLIPENKDWNDDLTLSGGNAQGFSMNEMR